MTDTLSRTDFLSSILDSGLAEELAGGAPVATPQAYKEIAQEVTTPEVDVENEPLLAAIEDDVEDVDTSGELGEDPAIEAPSTWSAEDKAEFAELDRASQEREVRRYQQQNKAVSKAIEEAASVKKRHTEELNNISRQREVLDKYVPALEQAFGNQYAGMTPQLWEDFRIRDPQNFLIERSKYEAQAAQIKVMNEARMQSAAMAYQHYREAEDAKVAEMAASDDNARKLLDPAYRAAVEKHAIERGYPEQLVKAAGALDLLMAQDSYELSRLRAKAKSQPSAPASRPTPQTRTRSPAGTTPRPQHEVQAAKLQNRLNQTKTRQDATNLFAASFLAEMTPRNKGV